MSWSDQQRRLAALGLYNGRIDNDPGDGTEAAVAALLSAFEKQHDIIPAPPITVAPVSGFQIPQTVPLLYRGWLSGIPILPRILQEGLKLYGVTEKAGTVNDPTIMAWAKECGLESVYLNDATAWCGLFMAVAAKRAGYTPPAGPLWALNWGKFGVVGPVAQLGDILTFSRPLVGGGTAGHVGIYIGEDAEAYHVLGGNQTDQVKIARVEKRRIRAIRRPAYKAPIAAWMPYHLIAAGGLSKSEA